MVTDEQIIKLFVNDKGKLKSGNPKYFFNKYPEIKNYLDNRYPKDEFLSYRQVIKRILLKIDSLPICANPNCNNKVLTYPITNQTHCCHNCCESDPVIKNDKKHKRIKTIKKNLQSDPDYYKKSFNKIRIHGKETKKKNLELDAHYYDKSYKLAGKNSSLTKKIKSEEDINYYKNIKKKQRHTIEENLANDPSYYTDSRKRLSKNLKKFYKNIQKVDPEYNERRVDKGIKTKKKRGTFNTSRPEKEFYNELLTIFSKDEIITEYKEERYPFYCDFYIKSLDLFIELNLHWTHGEHPFNKNNKKDIKILREAKKKAKTKPFYEVFIDIWTTKDINKIKTARNNNLNYITIYNKEEMQKLLLKLRSKL